MDGPLVDRFKVAIIMVQLCRIEVSFEETYGGGQRQIGSTAGICQTIPMGRNIKAGLDRDL